ncbi:MAG: S-layer protein domain-containing protein, partial [Methanobacteriota archaeon]
GNRIWDGSKDMSTTYSWSPMSFYAFYYDVDDNVGNETLQIRLNSKTDRTVPADRLIYTTVPENVNFKYNAWGTYKVIGFMADKYFAGYTDSTNIDEVDPVSTLNYKQLHKVLMDDKDSHTLRASTTYPLGDGYALNLKDIGAGRVAMISITKDGGEVDNAIVDVGETYTFSKKVGSINNLPIIVLHIRTVFMGTTDNMVQIDGIFQISESYTSVNQNNNYGMMEITTVGDSGITMKNDNSFTLSSGSTIDIMGDMKFIVANNDSVLRFAPMVKKIGEYEVRGTISNNETPSEWTPLSFEGFYYNIDEDIGTEKLTITRSSDTSRSVGENNVVYSTSSAQVSHKYSGLGKYDVIGFMAEKYFAGYEVGLISDKVISTMGRNQLHKVLIDDDTQRVIYAGSTLTLNEGYVLKIKDVNMGAGTAEVWLSLLKDGNEVDEDVVSAKDLYIYAPSKVGVISDLPIIALRVENIFRGKEATAAFVKGTFQISESYKTVKQGDSFDKMKIDSVSANTITMKNPSVVSLDAGSSDTLMGNMRLKVADSSDIRYYPYILVNGSALAANQLAINVPSTMMVKDVISISVTSGSGANADNAEVSFDGQVIGTTNSTGKLDYMLTKAGTHNFTATKLGYETATKTVKIDEYVDNRLSFELPEFLDQYIPVSIIVKVSGTGNATAGADITFDGTSIGKTDSSGTLTYTFTESGTHNLAASKPGFITVQREINVRLPFTEFKALDINFRPDIVNKGQNVYVWANITNTGTKEGMLPVALIINSTVVENSNITLAPGKNGEVNFSHKVELLPGNYTVEILGQKTTMPVKEEPLNLFLVAGIITILAAISIIVLTSKEILSIEALKAKLNMAPATDKPVINTEAINRAINDIKSKSNNAINDIMSKFKKK